jgi:hypothetical protein
MSLVINEEASTRLSSAEARMSFVHQRVKGTITTSGETISASDYPLPPAL